eukprot:981168-Pyramimonas_sp.AAC.1
MNFPEFVLNAIKTLYAKVATTILLGGVSHCSFRILRGIKQGCPLSGSAFALGFDPMLRLLCLRLPRPVHLRGAFADD